MSDFRKALKPGVARQNHGRMGFRSVLRLNGRIVWRGEFFSDFKYGDDASFMAKDAAETTLRCDDASLTAEQLQDIVDAS